MFIALLLPILEILNGYEVYEVYSVDLWINYQWSTQEVNISQSFRSDQSIPVPLKVMNLMRHYCQLNNITLPRSECHRRTPVTITHF